MSKSVSPRFFESDQDIPSIRIDLGENFFFFLLLFL